MIYNNIHYLTSESVLVNELHDIYPDIRDFNLHGDNIMPVLDHYLSVVEAAVVLRVHLGTVKRLCREGKLSAKKIHNMWLIPSNIVHSFTKEYEGRRGRPPTNRARK
jgi:excisionase family DNA binding protein